MDSLFENPDQTIPGQKRYAFGVEGISFRLRQAVGKGYLTDERLIADTCRFFEAIEGEGKGRAAWHLIAGLPGQKIHEVSDLMHVIKEIDKRRWGRTSRNLSLHWQPFQPLPGTPMQWCAAGGGARKLAERMRGIEQLPWCRVRQIAGRTDSMALLCSVLARADERGAYLLEAIAEREITPTEAEKITGASLAALDPDASLPWDFIDTAHPRATLRRAHDVMVSRLNILAD